MIRPPTEGDVAAIVDVFAPRPTDDEEIRGWLRNPRFDLDRDFRVAERDGRLVAYADVHWEGPRLIVDWAGELALLQPWVEERARELGVGRVRTWLWSAGEEGNELLRSLGYARVRQSFEMRIALDGTADEASLPDRVLFRTPREGEEREIHALIEEAFADSVDRPPRPFDEWWSYVGGYDRTYWIVAEAGGELVGAAVSRATSPGEPHVGWIEALGVRAPWRRRGVATALLRRSFALFRARGRSHAALGVDAENPTGALGVYERAGMSVYRTSATYDKELDPRPD